MKNIERLAVIREQYLLLRLDSFIKKHMESSLNNRKREDYSFFWKNYFKEGVTGYKEARELAVSSGLDISEYDKRFLELTQLYSELTGEKLI